MRRLALMIFIDSKNRVLLQRRSKNRKIFPDYWSFFGGKIENNEMSEKAIKREIMEELSIELKEFRFFKKYEVKEQFGYIEKNIFIGPLKWNLKILKSQQKEGEDMKLFSLGDLNNIRIPDNDITIINDVLRNNAISFEKVISKE